MIVQLRNTYRINCITMSAYTVYTGRATSCQQEHNALLLRSLCIQLITVYRFSKILKKGHKKMTLSHMRISWSVVLSSSCSAVAMQDGNGIVAAVSSRGQTLLHQPEYFDSLVPRFDLLTLLYT